MKSILKFGKTKLFMVVKILDIKFGLGSAVLIGELESWFKSVFETNDPLGSKLIILIALAIADDEKCSILISLFENEWGALYELLDQFCFLHGYGGFEKELRKNLKSWRKGRNEHCFLETGLAKHQEDGVLRILSINHTTVRAVSVNGDEKKYEIENLINIS